MRIISFDIETFPIVAYTWGPKWEANLLKVTQQIRLAMFAYKVLGDKRVYVHALPDYETPRELVQALWTVFDEADVLIAHNGKNFDIRQSNAFFLEFGFPPPSAYQVIDTKQVAKRHFRLPSNSLDDLAAFFNIPGKLATGGMDLWWDCMDNKPEAWNKMRRYNRQDVVVLEKVYLTMRSWMPNHPNLNVAMDRPEGCPSCGGKNVIRRGFAFTRTGKTQRYQCQDCSAWSSGRSETIAVVR